MATEPGWMAGTRSNPERPSCITRFSSNLAQHTFPKEGTKPGSVVSLTVFIESSSACAAPTIGARRDARRLNAEVRDAFLYNQLLIFVATISSDGRCGGDARNGVAGRIRVMQRESGRYVASETVPWP